MLTIWAKINIKCKRLHQKLGKCQFINSIDLLKHFIRVDKAEPITLLIINSIDWLKHFIGFGGNKNDIFV